jgi:hypothetical protein
VATRSTQRAAHAGAASAQPSAQQRAAAMTVEPLLDGIISGTPQAATKTKIVCTLGPKVRRAARERALRERRLRQCGRRAAMRHRHAPRRAARACAPRRVRAGTVWGARAGARALRHRRAA